MEIRPPHVLPQLMHLLQAGEGSTDEQITRALDVLVEQLDVDTAFVSRFVDGKRHFSHLVGITPSDEVITPSPAEETVCHLIATGRLPPVVADTASHPTLSTHPHITGVGIGAYLGVPLVVGGQVVGAVCGIAAEARPLLNERDSDRLATIGEFVGQILTQAEQTP